MLSMYFYHNHHFRNIRCKCCDGMVIEDAGIHLSAQDFNHTDKYTKKILQIVCPNCYMQEFYDSIEQWKSLGFWFKPSTWNDGYWESVNEKVMTEDYEGEMNEMKGVVK